MALVRTVVVTMVPGMHVVDNMLQSAVVAAVVVFWFFCSLLLGSSSALLQPAAASMVTGPGRHMARITVIRGLLRPMVLVIAAKSLQSFGTSAVVLRKLHLHSLLL